MNSQDPKYLNPLYGKIRYTVESILNSYSQVFFSDKPVFAILILLVTFLVPASGIAGLAGVCLSLLLAGWLGFDKMLISKGIFSYNTLLVTLPLGLFFKMGWPLILFILMASLMTFFLTVFFRSRMLKSNLPFLSWPFVIGLWIMMLSVRKFTSIEVGDQSLFEWNRIYQVGGISLVNGMEWLDQLPIPQSIRTYLTSLGAVFFQYNLIAGTLIAAGLLLSSRISFLLSLLGFFSAYIFYSVIGLDINSLDYSYIGFNYILTAIAVGGFFLIPNVYSFLWTIILIPAVTLLAVGTGELLSGTGLSVYALPFNLLVPVFLFVLQQRQSALGGLQPVIIQQNSPEKNLYSWSNYHRRLSRKALFLFRLPIMGKWKVSQGPAGPMTHQGDWRFAWDFVKEGPDGLTYSGSGFSLTDYHCYGKPVYPAADGVVDSIADGIPDNLPGDANTRQNWGNTVVVRHATGLYTKYAHLKPGTMRVKPGDYVLTSTELAQTGNSGRSPEPHLHFQFQPEPNINAVTIDYPFGYYISEKDGRPSLVSYSGPAGNDRVSNLVPDKLLKSALHFIPGQRILVKQTDAEGITIAETEWQVHTDYYNNSYIYERQSNATAWFVNDGQLFYFTHYQGARENPMFTFFSACFQVPLMFDRQLVIADQLPLSVMTRNWLRWVQDWVSPFYLFLHSRFFLNFAEADDALDPSVYRLESRVSQEVFRRSMDTKEYSVQIHRDGNIRITASGQGILELTNLKG